MTIPFSKTLGRDNLCLNEIKVVKLVSELSYVTRLKNIKISIFQNRYNYILNKREDKIFQTRSVKFICFCNNKKILIYFQV